MKALDLVGSAIGNTFRSKTRTILTILAIFVGAFTLTITNGLGTGINRYIDDTVAAIGAEDVMTVTKVAENATDAGDGPREYDPDAVAGAPVPGPPGSMSIVAPIGGTQLDELAAVDGVERVQPVKSIDADYVVARRRHPLRDRHRRVHHRHAPAARRGRAARRRRHPGTRS